MNLPEQILLAYLGYMLALAVARPISPASRMRVVVWSLCFGAALIAVSRLPQSGPSAALRPMLPLAGILWSYYLSGVFFTAPQEATEARFKAFDRRIRHWIGAEDFDRRAPRAILEFLELSYLACYAVLLAGVVTVIAAGQVRLLDRFWSIVVLAELACYAMLPWIRTRPGWRLCPNPALDRRRLRMRRINLFLVTHASTRCNTFPSGHVAGAVATSLALTAIVPQAVPVFLFLAIAISAGAVAGEYHYAGDAIAGALVALAAWAIVTAAGV